MVDWTLPRVSPSEPRDPDDEIGPGYDWAIVSGGQPFIPSSASPGADDNNNDDDDATGTCKTGDGVNNSGLWLFTRQKVADEDVVAEMRAVLEEKGFDVSVLKPVEHEGCEYPDEL